MHQKFDLLLVDDDPVTVEAMVILLGTDFALRYAPNGAAALEKVQEKTPDLIILDIEMPGLSGFEVAKKIRANLATEHLPILFLTGHRTVNTAIEAFLSGASDYIRKPPEKSFLMAKIYSLLRSR